MEGEDGRSLGPECHLYRTQAVTWQRKVSWLSGTTLDCDFVSRENTYHSQPGPMQKSLTTNMLSDIKKKLILFTTGGGLVTQSFSE